MSILLIVPVLVILVFSAVFHEVAHGWMALRFGDSTARDYGRLTLNPIPHIDPMLTIFLPMMLMLLGMPIIGGAKPVPVDYQNLHPFRSGVFWVGAAGILTNFIIVAVVGIMLRLLMAFDMAADITIVILSLIIWINCILGLFNLLPMPPLDGSKMLFSALGLSYDQQVAIEMNSRYFLIGLIVLVVFMPGSLSFLFASIDFLFQLAAGFSFSALTG
ncbi:MAG: site-2 protease family protein [bacterium]|nr:site-2 protease family protein [bacterium]